MKPIKFSSSPDKRLSNNVDQDKNMTAFNELLSSPKKKPRTEIVKGIVPDNIVQIEPK